MTIISLTVHHVCIPLKRPIRHASHARAETDSLIVCCRLADGSVGWGEGLPRAYVTGETIDVAWQILQATGFREQLCGDMQDPAAALDALAEVSLSRETGDSALASYSERGCLGNSVRCAIELSVLDAACRSAGVPFSNVTTLVPEAAPLRRQIGEVQYSGVITSDRPLSVLHSAFKQRIYGFRQIKVKVGTLGTDDFALLRRIRRIVGRRVDLRIDANEAWTVDSLAETLAPLTLAHISSVEQPVPHAEVGRLAAVREDLPVPLMLDESLCSMSDATRAIDEGLCDLFNIRLSKCGGFVPSLKIAAEAASAGLGYQLGCQVGETGILSAAGRHFATSVGGIQYVEGSYDRHLVLERLTVEDLTFGYGGRAGPLSGPGLGVTVDEAALSRVTKRRTELR